MFILNMFTDFGFKAYVTRHETADDELLQTVWTSRFLRNLVLGLVMVLGAAIAPYFPPFQPPRAEPAVRVRHHRQAEHNAAAVCTGVLPGICSGGA